MLPLPKVFLNQISSGLIHEGGTFGGPSQGDGGCVNSRAGMSWKWMLLHALLVIDDKRPKNQRSGLRV